MKVISFKVDDVTYFALKKILKPKNLSFRSIFEPLAIQLTQNNSRATKYTGGIRKENDCPYIDVSQLEKTIAGLTDFVKKIKHGGKIK